MAGHVGAAASLRGVPWMMSSLLGYQVAEMVVMHDRLACLSQGISTHLASGRGLHECLRNSRYVEETSRHRRWCDQVKGDGAATGGILQAMQ